MAKEKAAKKVKGRGNKPPRGERWRQIRSAFSITRQRDPSLIPWMILGFGVPAAILFGIFTLLGTWIVVNAVVAVMAGVLGLMIVFGRRVRRAAFSQAEGQPGAAAWALESLRGDWRTTVAVAGTSQLDVVHRILGRPGVVLVGEGAPHRVRNLLASEKRRAARIAGDAPIYDLIVGEDEGQVPLSGLQKYFLKLPRNLTPAQLNALETRMAALGGSKTGLPKGPIPKGGRISGMERMIRRR